MPNRGGFSWKRAVGISAAKSRVSRKIGIPLTKSGRQRKVGRMVTGGSCLIQALALVLLATVAACSGSGDPAALIEQTNPPSAEQLAAEALCAGSTYTACVQDVILATTLSPGGLAAICQTADGKGGVVLLDSKDEAATQCAENADPASTVFKVITIPGTPPPSEAPTPKPLAISKVSVTSAVARGGTAKVTVKTAAKADCSIDVEYDSGQSTAAGLGDKKADGTGKVSWSWQVGINTDKGTVPIYVTCTKGDLQGSLDLQFRVK